MGRAHLGADHAVRRVAQFVDVGGLDGLGEARPATARFELVRRGEQRLARYDVDIDTRLLVVQIFAGARGSRCRFAALRDTAPAKARDGVGVLAEVVHVVLLVSVLQAGWSRSCTPQCPAADSVVSLETVQKSRRRLGMLASCADYGARSPRSTTKRRLSGSKYSIPSTATLLSCRSDSASTAWPSRIRWVRRKSRKSIFSMIRSRPAEDRTPGEWRNQVRKDRCVRWRTTHHHCAP